MLNINHEIRLFVCLRMRMSTKDNNLKTKHKNDTNCGSAFEPGASGLPYHCASICVRSWGNWCGSSVDFKPKKKTVAQLGSCCTWRASCVAAEPKKTKQKRDQQHVLVVREIDCGDWLTRGYMPAHQHCDLFYRLDGDLIGSAIN